MSSEIEETRNIEATLIIEVIGKPPEHLVETLERIIKEIGEEKGVEVIGKKINEPVLMKDQTEFYTTFAEVEVKVEQIIQMVILTFKYMPAHVDIVHPELIALSNNGWNDVINELTRRLHGYDEIARVLQHEKGILEKKLRETLGKSGQTKNEN